MKNFLKGVIAGIGNIIPGVSGSALLIIFGLYEKCIEAISNIFKNFKKNFLFLLPIGLGAVLGIFSFSNIIEYCITKYETITFFIFLGLLVGTLPSLFNKSKKDGFKKSYLIPFFITMAIGLVLLFVKSTNTFNIEVNFFTSILIGLVIAFATVVPGISNTVLLTMMGLYTTFLSAINHLDIKLLFPIFIGVAIGTFVLSKILNKLFKKYHGYTYFGILGFVIATIPGLIPTPIVFNRDTYFGIVLAIISFYISYLITKKETVKSLDKIEWFFYDLKIKLYRWRSWILN